MSTHNWGAGDPRTSTAAWRRLRQHVIDRDGHRCANCHTEQGTLELDHIVNVKAGGTDHPDNARLLCGPCHKIKTAAEATTGRRARAARGAHPTEKHPGLL